MFKGKVSSPKHISPPLGFTAGTMLNKYSTVIDRLPSLSMVRYFTRGESCILYGVFYGKGHLLLFCRFLFAKNNSSLFYSCEVSHHIQDCLVNPYHFSKIFKKIRENNLQIFQNSIS